MSRFIWSLLVSLLVLLSVVGCGDEAEPLPSNALPRQLDVSEKALVQTSNHFGLSLFKEVHAEAGPGTNVFISPLSVAMVLGMLDNGAAGNTQAQIEQVLGLQGLTLEEFNGAAQSLMALLASADPQVQIAVVNSIWYRDDFAVGSDFISLNQEFYNAEVSALDFSDPTSLNTINGWVGRSTNGLITKIVDSIDPLDVFFVINATYFKASWSEQFKPERTEAIDFRLDDGVTLVRPPMMQSGKRDIELTHDPEAGVVIGQIPYGGGAFQFTVVMPAVTYDPETYEESFESLSTVVDALDGERWDRWMQGFEPEEATVLMPRFEMDFEYALEDSLKLLGMEDAFTEDANFSGIANRVYITDVTHKTYVRVDEEGTEAAAVTSAGGGSILVNITPPALDLDRPFVFAIRERNSGAILFIGAMYDPTL